MDETYAGAEVAVKHIGPSVARKWYAQLRQHRVAEIRRIKDLRKEYPKDEWPELYMSEFPEMLAVTEQAQDELQAICLGIARDAVVGWRGMSDEEDALQGEDLYAEFDRHGLGLTVGLLNAASEVQAVSPETFPARKDSGDDGAERPAEPESDGYGVSEPVGDSLRRAAPIDSMGQEPDQDS